MIIFVVSVALLTLCNLATFLLSLPSNLMAEKRDARRESSATNKTTLLTVGDSSVEQKNAPYDTSTSAVPSTFASYVRTSIYKSSLSLTCENMPSAASELKDLVKT
jgi:hypothetical protein